MYLEIYFFLYLKKNKWGFWKQLLFDYILMYVICEPIAVDNPIRLRCSNVPFTSMK